MYEFFRRVVTHLDFLKNYFSLPFDFIKRKSGIQKNVGKQIGRPWEEFSQNLRVITDIFVSGERVQYPPHRVDLAGDLMDIAACRPLKQHMFNKMSNAVILGSFVAGAVGYPYSGCYRVHVPDVLGNDPNAIIKSRCSYHE